MNYIDQHYKSITTHLTIKHYKLLTKHQTIIHATLSILTLFAPRRKPVTGETSYPMQWTKHNDNHKNPKQNCSHINKSHSKRQIFQRHFGSIFRCTNTNQFDSYKPNSQNNNADSKRERPPPPPPIHISDERSDQIRSDQNQCADLMREFESERVSDRNEHAILDRENCEKERSIEEILPKDPSGWGRDRDGQMTIWEIRWELQTRAWCVRWEREGNEKGGKKMMREREREKRT